MMKKQMIFILLLIPMLISAQITDRICIDQKELNFIKDHGFDRIQYGHDYIHEWGHPELPVILKSYVVPINAENFNIQAHIEYPQLLNNEYYIYPVQKPQKLDHSKSEEFTMPDSVIYASDSLYPAKSSEIVFNQVIQGYRIITVATYPVIYRPIKKEIYLRNLSYTINYTLGNMHQTSDTKITLNRFNAAKGFVENIVCNPDDIEQYSHFMQVVVPPTDLNWNEHKPQLRSAGNNIIEEIIPDFVIITNKQLKSAFQILANWKIKKGIPTIIKTVEEIREEYPGSDLTQKIRNYLIDIRSR